MAHAEFIAIAQPHETIQASLIQGALENEGIPAYVSNENFAAARGSIGIGISEMAVMVPEDQAEQAIEIIKGLGLE